MKQITVPQEIVDNFVKHYGNSPNLPMQIKGGEEVTLMVGDDFPEDKENVQHMFLYMMTGGFSDKLGKDIYDEKA